MHVIEPNPRPRDGLRALAGQLRLVETLAWEQNADPELVHDEIVRAWRIDGPEALRLLACTAATRLQQLADHHYLGGEPGTGLRETFHASATTDDHGLVDACLDLVDHQHRNSAPGADPLGEALVAAGLGPSALVELLSIAMTAGHHLTEAAGDLTHPHQLLAREAADMERRWLKAGPW